MFIEEINGITLCLETDSTLFSPGKIDAGTQAMLSCIELHETDKLLDLGCGYGPVGIWAAKKIGADKVVMCDILPQAVAQARENALQNGVPSLRIVESNGFTAISDHDFTLILSNPPYHADFSVPKKFIEEGFRHLQLGGRMVMVTKRLDWYKNKLTSVFGGVRINETNGYYVMTAEKRFERPPAKRKKPQKLSKKLERAKAKKNRVKSKISDIAE